MSKPLWLMMGTAFKIARPTDSAPEASTVHTGRTFFLTAKHTFIPWCCSEAASSLKIPEEYRKSRYVIGRLYAPLNDTHQRANASCFAEISLISSHPTLDVALLATKTFHDQSIEQTIAQTLPLSLCTDKEMPAQGAQCVINGFRGEGKLGELDTFDAGLLQKLSPKERETLLKELESVEGKQVAASTFVEVLDPLGMGHGIGDYNQCFHGMSGSPLLTLVGNKPLCCGVLYGKHPDYPENIGFIPSNAILPWIHNAIR
ncbi:unnamed protein product [Phytomonas sp. EM1]|nr:unnamed protein product [Phytomonas sp. EM1]|eukprot:CCW65042.1 unnamed protein product [Phytomonas sp. isolate EM1]